MTLYQLRRPLIYLRAGNVDVPKNVPLPLTTPVSLFDIIFLYASKLVNRIAILGTMPVITAPNPLYKPSGVSRFTISAPVVRKPRFGAPGARARRDSCMRTLIVSRGRGYQKKLQTGRLQVSGGRVMKWRVAIAHT